MAINARGWRIHMLHVIAGLCVAGLGVVHGALADGAPPRNETVPGEFTIERPTLRSLGFEWQIEGDDNRNGVVTVTYRRKGDALWKAAQPLLRIHHEKIYVLQPPKNYTCGNLYAGSILFLDPDTEYEACFKLTDPDGGEAQRVVTARTRPEPSAFAGGRQLHVYPEGHAGDEATPRYADIMAAYDQAQPGDIIRIHAGVYAGKLALNKAGTPGKPIVFRGAGDGRSVLIGEERDHMIRVGADHIWFEDLTLRHPGATPGDAAIVCYNQNPDKGVDGLVVRRCQFEDINIGIIGGGFNLDYYIADNLFLGRNDTFVHSKKNIKSRIAVVLGGQGHVVCYNRVMNFWDGIGITSGGSYPRHLDAGPQRKICAIDYHNNDIRNVLDDFIETDYGSHNIRVWENRCFNSGVSGLSAQPVYGGPVYFIRNVLYNIRYNIEPERSKVYAIYGGNCFKLHCGAAGALIYHNTVSGSICHDWFWSNCHFRNNIFMNPMQSGTMTDYSTLDYNAYRAREGWPLFWWRRLKNSHLMAQLDEAKDRREAIKILNGIKTQTRDDVVCDDLAAVRTKLGYEAHGMTVDYDIFRNASAPQPQPTPDLPKPQPETIKPYDPNDVDLRLRDDAPTVDAGEVLANINDGYVGSAPDLGAYEVGGPSVHYGPR